MTQLALLRHGHTAWNRAGQIQGRSDIPLEPDAREALSGLTLPAPWHQADLVSSPLERARDTAQLVGGRAPDTIPALTEMNWGDWEGKKGVDLKADPESGFRDIEAWGWSYRPPGGESPDEVWQRLRPWVETLTRDTVAVTHIGIMRVLLAKATGWDFEGPAPFRIKRNRLFVLQLSPRLHVADAEPVRLIER